MSTGKFCWFDLMSSDVPAARSFYGALLGWNLEDHNPGYTMIRDAEGRTLGGMMGTAPGRPSGWLPYVTTDDVTATTAKIRASGGTIFREGAAAGVGRFVIFGDRQGAVLSAIQLDNEQEYPREKAKSHITWAELQTTDIPDAVAFHTGIFGWPTREWTPEYILIGEDHAGGIAPAHGPPAWLIYVNVGDADATAKRVEALGGRTFVAPRPMGRIGQFAVFGDPTGGMFAVMQSAERG
jgi:predicted enzyme related to lactoylglutathione lyase